MSNAPAVSLVEMIQSFPTEDKCLEYLKRLRWPDEVSCVRDGADVRWLKNQQKFECLDCKYQFSITAGTIFHDSHLPLKSWFLATYLMCESRKGVSANQIKRTLGISYKTAWFLCHRIRVALREVDPKPLCGTIEVDETYVGGKRRGVGRGNRDNKTMVLAAIQRGKNGQVRLRVDNRADRKTLHAFIHSTTSKKTKAVYTDDWAAYKGMDRKHDSVNHSAKEWVRGDVHTNSVENVFSLLKRSIIGAYHHVSVKHLPKYLDELQFRFDRRNVIEIFENALRFMVQADPLTFQKLVNEGT